MPRRCYSPPMSAEAPPSLTELLDTLELVADDRSQRIQLLIDTADRFEDVPPEVATRPFDDRHKAPHGESDAYVFAAARGDGTADFHFAVENPQGISARAMAVILHEACSGADPESVLAIPSDVPYQIFGRELSMGKNMGLMGMVALVHAEAKKLAAAKG